MNTQTFLFHYGQYVAYITVWVIHCFYIGTLLTRSARVRRESAELKSGSAKEK